MRTLRWSLGFALLLVVLTGCSGKIGVIPPGMGQGTPASTASGTSEEQQLAQRLFNQINKDRAANGRSALKWEPLLERSAHQHNLVMIAGCGLQHVCPNEADLGTRISKQGVQWQTVGENIGEGGPILGGEDAAWNMTSMLHQGMMGEKPPDDGHRRNLLSPDFHRIGISITIDKNSTLWLTEDFAN